MVIKKELERRKEKKGSMQEPLSPQKNYVTTKKLN